MFYKTAAPPPTRHPIDISGKLKKEAQLASFFPGALFLNSCVMRPKLVDVARRPPHG